MVASTMNELWLHAATTIIESGHIVTVRGKATTEHISAQFMLTSPEANVLVNPVRKMDLAYAVGELFWYLRRSNNLTEMSQYAPSYKQYSDDGVTLAGAYGPRMDLRQVLKLLRADESSRQAVIPLYNASDLHNRWSKDIPCTLTMQFLVRESRLILIVNMRSNDLWLGMPYDVFAFTTIQCMMAKSLDLKVGPYIHNVGSLHIYDTDMHKVLAAIESPYAKKESPVIPVDDYFTLAKVEDVAWTGPSMPVSALIKQGEHAIDLWKCTAHKFNKTIWPANPTLQTVIRMKESDAHVDH